MAFKKTNSIEKRQKCTFFQWLSKKIFKMSQLILVTGGEGRFAKILKKKINFLIFILQKKVSAIS